MSTPKNTILLYADIVGYTKLMRADKDDALTKLEHFKATMQSQTQAYQGEVLQLHRDYCIAAFERAMDAVACAETLQMNFKAEPNVPVRMGIHAGEVIVENGNAFGEGVLEVTQLERIAISGSVVMSKEIQEEIADNEQFALEYLGTFTFKNVDNSIELFALSNDGLTVPESSAEMQAELKQANQKRWLRALQLFAGYLVAAWTILQFVDWLLIRYEISYYWTDILLWTFVGIIPSLLIYLVHQDRFHQRVLLQREKIIIPLNILLLFGALTVAYGGADLGSITKTVNFTDIDGQRTDKKVVKSEFIIEIPIFPFEQTEKIDSTTWIGMILPKCLATELTQDKYLSAIDYREDFGTVEKIQKSKLSSGKYYIDGSYQVLTNSFAITPMLRDKKNGKIIEQETFQGEDFFGLIDSMGIFLRKAVGLTPAQMDESINLPFKDYFTDNFEALKYYAGSYRGNYAFFLKQALQLDSTFAIAGERLALGLQRFSWGEWEQKLVIAQAMRHRDKLPWHEQIRVMFTHYWIKNEWEKAEELLKMQLEQSPNNPLYQKLAIELYSTTGQFDKWAAFTEKLYEQDPTITNRIEAMRAALRIGEAKKVERSMLELLEETPQALEVLELLSEAYILQKKYDEAREIIKRMILIDPEAEITLSKTLTAIDYMQNNPITPEYLARFEGKYRDEGSTMYITFLPLNGVIYTKASNQSGFFKYPAGEDVLLRGSINQSFREELKINEAGDVYALKSSQGDRTRDLDSGYGYRWKQDSSIWRAEALLLQKDYERALPAYELAISKHPEHYYLYNFKQHVEYMLSHSEEYLQNHYQKIAGQYGGNLIWVENSELIGDPGVGPLMKLLLISDDQNIVFRKYDYLGKLKIENGEILGVRSYLYDAEKQEYRNPEGWYWEKKKLRD